ncbi:protocatechuate 3,4-dioxygenase subunit beta [Gryllotalpicola ginsengisoli]|uniref:protocatechuate 3,4-dioxygenase subunit beta n=1 Tax=Gryllotalpicola ginsengisoli TaxID=444608 RepID=UPI0003B46C44|nr:protocatechuate 3,4-dioxygenase subunit beta [Gryllotalpicola ginsengisoli]
MSTTGESLSTQDEVTAEIGAVQQRYRDDVAAGRQHTVDTLLDFPPYRSSELRHPTKDPHLVDPETIELVSPAFGHWEVAPIEADLTNRHVGGEPQGQRMVVTGRVLDGNGRPVRHQLVELWQANAGGRYIHQRDRHPAPLDPNFTGAGRVITDDEGRYRFTTIKPGAYPWRNHLNAWRPAHIHFSIFGNAFTQRLVTQMYFPDDPLFALDPIYQSIPDQKARDRLIATYDHELTTPEWALGFRWDIVVDGPQATWFEQDGDQA